MAKREVDEGDLRELCEIALYWSATPAVVALVRRVMPEVEEGSSG